MGPETQCIDLRAADFIVTNVCSIVRGRAKAHNSYQLIVTFFPQVTFWKKQGQHWALGTSLLLGTSLG